jgi:hypothetical protein
MVLAVGSGEPLDLVDVLDGLAVLAEGEEDLLDLGLEVVDVRVLGDVFNDVALGLERIEGLALRFSDEGDHLGLVGASHCGYIISIGRCEERLLLLLIYVSAFILQTQVREVHLQHPHLRLLRHPRCPLGYSLLHAGVWVFYPSLYNTVYTDFIPPARGVERRNLAHEEV